MEIIKNKYMPQNFDKCVSDGGRVITKNVNATQYMHICYPRGGGSAIAGEVRTKKKLSFRKKKNA